MDKLFFFINSTKKRKTCNRPRIEKALEFNILSDFLSCVWQLLWCPLPLLFWYFWHFIHGFQGQREDEGETNGRVGHVYVCVCERERERERWRECEKERERGRQRERQQKQQQHKVLCLPFHIPHTYSLCCCISRPCLLAESFLTNLMIYCKAYHGRWFVTRSTAGWGRTRQVSVGSARDSGMPWR